MSSEGEWFAEKSRLWPGQAFTLEIEEKLADFQSEYQHIQVFKTKNYGGMLVLDGAIQFTERDEFSYQEMMAHVPLFSHPDPKKVLIVGGGDGGVLREVVKHPLVEKAILCDIDKGVIETSKKYFPSMSSAMDHPKAEVITMDGFKYLKDHPETFDVIITDASDPDGPAESLFQREYFSLLKNALRPNGILCSQGECMWLHLRLIKELMGFCKEMFPVAEFGYVAVPSYPSGQLGFVVCAKGEVDVKRPSRPVSEEIQKTLRYYNGDIHAASFVLPQFLKRELE